MTMQRLKGKTAIITGGALGIGGAACLLFAQHGANVAVTDILDKEGEEVVRLIQETGGKAHYWHLDTRNELSAQNVCAEVHKKFGSLDILVNNAGIVGVNKPTHEITEKEWDDLMAVNVKGVFFCTKHVIPFMKNGGGGSIVNISSIYGLIGGADMPPYHASKGAVRLMSKTDALLYAKDKIRVNSVHPAYIWTPLLEKLGQSHPRGIDAFREEAGKLHPLGHIGEADDVAYGILYLASDESKFVTGSELVIDGGYTAQ